MAFNGDPAVEREVRRLVKAFDVKHIIETGTFKGGTTTTLASMVDRVDTVEINEEFWTAARTACAPIKNICCHLGDSVKRMPDMLRLGKSPKLAYLDAHWWDHLPLNDELDHIARICPDECIVVIDDFKVPHRNYQFDIYQGKPIDIDLVHAALERAMPGGCVYYYLSHSEKGPMMGYDGVPRDGVGKLYAIPCVMLAKAGLELTDFVTYDEGIPFSNL